MAKTDTPCPGEIVLRAYNKLPMRADLWKMLDTWHILNSEDLLFPEFVFFPCVLPFAEDDMDEYDDDWENEGNLNAAPIYLEESGNTVASVFRKAAHAKRLEAGMMDAKSDDVTEYDDDDADYRDHMTDVYRFSTSCILAGWRPRQSIVRFAPGIAERIIKNFSPSTPAQEIWGLPDWTIYFDVPLQGEDLGCDGFFAANDIVITDRTLDAKNDADKCLMLGFVKDEHMLVFRLPIKETAEQAWELAFKEFLEYGVTSKMLVPVFVNEQIIADALALVSYVVKYGYDVGTDWRKTMTCPQPKKVKQGLRFFPAKKPTIHILGKYVEDGA